MPFNLSAVLGVKDLPEQLKKVDEKLFAVVAGDKTVGLTIERLIKAGGKRLRPSLIIACASLNDKKINDDVIKLAAAVELIHISSLVHDDIIDEADSRWNVPTVYKTEGIGHAIVVGDYLLAMGCALAAEVNQTAARVTALTVTELCAGQALELNNQGNLNRSLTNYYRSIGGKTAALIKLSCVLGGICAGLNKKQLEQLKDFGYNFGLSFQIIDDLMDLVSSPVLYGKPVGNDINERIYTLPVIMGLKKQSGLKKHVNNGLVEELLKNGAIDETLQAIQHFNKLAETAITSLRQPAALKLKTLPAAYLDWCLNNLVDDQYKKHLLKMQQV